MVGAQREVVAIVDENQAMQASLPFLLQVIGEHPLGVELAVRPRLIGVTIPILVRTGTPTPGALSRKLPCLGARGLLKCRRAKTKCCFLL
jgi:hypothetical protein